MAKPKKHYGKWRIRPIGPDGKRTSVVFDTYKEALHAIQVIETERREIQFGHRALIRKDRTFNDLCDYWIKFRAKKRSAKNDQSIINRHLRPRWGELLLINFSGHHGLQYELENDHLDKKTIFNHLTLLIAMLNLAKAIKWLGEVPKITKPKIRLIAEDFRYLKNDTEVKRFLGAAKARGEQYYALYFTAIMTGMREGELAGLRWSDIDLENRRIIVQRSFCGPTKSDEPRHIPILDPLFTYLNEWKKGRYTDFVFPNNKGKMHQPSARIFQEYFQKILTEAGFERRIRKNRSVPYIVFHDLRHTFASHWVMKGGDIFRLQKILGHQSLAMTMRYAHLAPDAFASDLARLSSLGPSQSGNVVPFVTNLRK